MCLLLPFLISKNKKADRAKYEAEAGRAPRLVADGYADANTYSTSAKRERGHSRSVVVSSG